MSEQDTGGLTPEQFAEAFTPRDANGDSDFPVPPEEYTEFLDADAADLEPNIPGPHISLTEAPMPAPDGSIGIQVPVNLIMDQVHQHWARQMADQIQRNAELAAALTVTSEELDEVRGKLAALTEVTNAPAEETPQRVRSIDLPD